MPRLYPKQAALAVLAAGACSYFFYSSRGEVIHALGLGLIVYVALRVIVAFAFRIKYWYHRGTRRIYTTQCGKCQQRIYRMGGDWILKCHRCGWKPGLPVLRWFTQSVPAIQFRRSLTRTRGILLVGAVVLLLAPAVTFPAGGAVDASSPATGASGAAAATPTSTPTPAIAPREIEKDILASVNGIRVNHSLGRLSNDAYLHRQALQHAKDLNTYGYDELEHAGPHENADQRFRRIASQCGRSAGENIHEGMTYREMIIYGTDEEIYVDDSASATQYTVVGWMHSPPHRKNILTTRWTKAGVGFYVNDQGDFYASIIFCG